MIKNNLYNSLYDAMLIIKSNNDGGGVEYIQQCGGSANCCEIVTGHGILISKDISNVLYPQFWTAYYGVDYVERNWEIIVNQTLKDDKTIENIWALLEKSINKHIHRFSDNTSNFIIKKETSIEAWVECCITIDNVIYDAILTWRNSD